MPISREFYSQGKATFEDAAEEAKRELYPELNWKDETETFNVPACRLCEGVGAHKEGCKLLNPDGKARAAVEDLISHSTEEKKLAPAPVPVIRVEAPIKPVKPKADTTQKTQDRATKSDGNSRTTPDT